MKIGWEKWLRRALARPLPMILFCPSCGYQHVDAPKGDWTNPPHRSHLCAGCGHVWRPADIPTEGVAEIMTAGKNDDPPIRQLAVLRRRRVPRDT